jgi:hypothetical protein
MFRQSSSIEAATSTITREAMRWNPTESMAHRYHILCSPIERFGVMPRDTFMVSKRSSPKITE